MGGSGLSIIQLDPSLDLPNAKSNLLLDSNRFDWRIHYVVRRCGLAIENIEHARDAFETEHVISSFVQHFEIAKKKKKKYGPTCLLVSQFLAAPVLVCHLRLGAPLLTSALISRAPCGRRVLENPHVFVKLDSCPDSVFVS
jgi:hypothetical protein